MDEYIIRKAKLEDMEFIISQAKNEGWNPGLHDDISFFSADKDGFFIGELNGGPISCISAVKYENFGFIGLYIVKNDYRGNNYGLNLWTHAMNRLFDCNIGLDGVIDQQSNYRKSGFWLANRNIRFQSEITPNKSENKCIVNTDSLDFNDLVEYDSQHFPSERSDFLKAWLTMHDSSSLAFVKDSKIMGYGTIRKCFSGYKIGPLFAENFSVAESLFLQLINFSNGESVYLDISEKNQDAKKLVEKYNMNFVFETARMYTGQKPNFIENEVYGITSFELG